MRMQILSNPHSYPLNNGKLKYMFILSMDIHYGIFLVLLVKFYPTYMQLRIRLSSLISGS